MTVQVYFIVVVDGDLNITRHAGPTRRESVPVQSIRPTYTMGTDFDVRTVTRYVFGYRRTSETVGESPDLTFGSVLDVWVVDRRSV